jgi:hypothetical protein
VAKKAAKLRAVLADASVTAFDTPHVVFLLAARPEHAKGRRCRGIGAGRRAAQIVPACYIIRSCLRPVTRTVMFINVKEASLKVIAGHTTLCDLRLDGKMNN